MSPRGSGPVSVVVMLPSWDFLRGCCAALRMGSVKCISSLEVAFPGDKAGALSCLGCLSFGEEQESQQRISQDLQP